jgi:hypothetical protein
MLKVKRFHATDGAGWSWEILATQLVTIEPCATGSVEIEDVWEFRTADGRAVNQIGEQQYRLGSSGAVLTSTEPDPV